MAILGERSSRIRKNKKLAKQPPQSRRKIKAGINMAVSFEKTKL
jgi:hypothetical protein